MTIKSCLHANMCTSYSFWRTSPAISFHSISGCIIKSVPNVSFVLATHGAAKRHIAPACVLPHLSLFKHRTAPSLIVTFGLHKSSVRSLPTTASGCLPTNDLRLSQPATTSASGIEHRPASLRDCSCRAHAGGVLPSTADHPSRVSAVRRATPRRR